MADCAVPQAADNEDYSFEANGPPTDPQAFAGQMGNMDTQWFWHAAYRDTAKNMYRTTYQDMIHGRESYVKSTFPAGYGGHDPRVRHDVLFKNGDFDKTHKLKATDVSRDAMVNFDANITGVPGFCYNPCGAKKVPTLGTVPKVGQMKAPWAVTKPDNPAPGFRRAPPMTSSMRHAARMARSDGFGPARQVSEPSLPSARGVTPLQHQPAREAPAQYAPAAAAPQPSMGALAQSQSTPSFRPGGTALRMPKYGDLATQRSGGIENALRRSMSQTSYSGAFTNLRPTRK